MRGMAKRLPQRAKWGAAMEAPPREPDAVVKVCPRCELTVPAESRICRRCLHRLRDTDVVAADGLVEASEQPERSRWVAPRGGLLARFRLRRRVRVLALLVAASVLFYFQVLHPEAGLDTPSGTRSLTAGAQAWPSTGGDAGNTRAPMSDAPLHGEPVWRRPLGAPATTPVVTDGSALYVGLADARLMAYATDDGRELWSTSVPGQLEHAPAVAGDAVYASLRGGYLVALDAATGDERWRYPTGDILTGPAVAAGVVWVGSGRDYIISLDAESGELLGNDGFATPRRSLGAPVIGAERVAFRTRDRVHLFDIESGNHEFFGVLEDLEHVAAGHSVVVALSAARVVVFDEDEEQPWWERWRRWWYQLDIFGVAPHVPPQPQRWNARTGCEPLAPVIAPRMLFVGCEMGRVRAYDLETGAEEWTHEGMALVDSPVLLERGLLLVGQSALVLLDPASGAEVERRELDGVLIRQVTPTGQGTYIVTAGNELLAIR